MINPAAPENNRYHTTVSYRSKQEELEEWQRDKAETEYFAHVEGITHNYPHISPSSILVVNEPINLGESPF